MSNEPKYKSKEEFFSAIETKDFSLSYSALKTLKNGYQDFFDYYLLPRKDTAATLKGTAFHTFILQPEIFFERYQIAPDDYKTAGSQKWLNLEKEKGKKLIDSESLEFIKAVKANLLNSENGVVQTLLDAKTQKEYEIPLATKINDTNVKGFIDAISDKCIIDLKFASTPIEYYSSYIYKYCYHLQAYIYKTAAYQIFKKQLPFYHVVIFDNKEYRIFQFSKDLLDSGAYLFLELVSKFNCLKLNENEPRDVSDKTILI